MDSSRTSEYQIHRYRATSPFCQTVQKKNVFFSFFHFFLFYRKLSFCVIRQGENLFDLCSVDNVQQNGRVLGHDSNRFAQRVPGSRTILDSSFGQNDGGFVELFCRGFYIGGSCHNLLLNHGKILVLVPCQRLGNVHQVSCCFLTTNKREVRPQTKKTRGGCFFFSQPNEGKKKKKRRRKKKIT